MHLCYLDESGGCEAPDLNSSATPVMVLLGLVIDTSQVPALTRDFLALKRRHFPGRFSQGPALDHILTEVKGSEILQMTRSSSRNKRRQADRFRSELLDLATDYECRILGRVWIKEVGKSLKPTPTYCRAVQDISLHFSQYLLRESSGGLIIADHRTEGQNFRVSHSIFTQKWKTGGDPYPPLLEVPVFGQSVNHAGLQFADLIASTLVFPMAASAYPNSLSGYVHGSKRYEEVRRSFKDKVNDLQYRYRDEHGRWRGGLVVSDPGLRRSGSLLFS